MPTPWNEPFDRFNAIFEAAKKVQPKDPNAVTLATVDSGGRPSARVVLLKGVDPKGFVIFTNYESRKGRELLGPRAAALCFYWPALDQQVRVEGRAEPVSEEESDAYFATRARISQLGAWASLQSQPLSSRKVLEQRLAEFTAKFEGGPVPRPPHWGGIRIPPERMEFWKAGENRLHDRVVYEKVGNSWFTTALFP
jgi:pyridoxamine 5'-phosphate oxidase